MSKFSQALYDRRISERPVLPKSRAARALGVSYMRYSRWEEQKFKNHIIHMHEIKTISNWLGISVLEFIELFDEDSAEDADHQ